MKKILLAAILAAAFGVAHAQVGGATASSVAKSASFAASSGNGSAYNASGVSQYSYGTISGYQNVDNTGSSRSVYVGVAGTTGAGGESYSKTFTSGNAVGGGLAYGKSEAASAGAAAGCYQLCGAFNIGGGAAVVGASKAENVNKSVTWGAYGSDGISYTKSGTNSGFSADAYAKNSPVNAVGAYTTGGATSYDNWNVNWGNALSYDHTSGSGGGVAGARAGSVQTP